MAPLSSNCSYMQQSQTPSAARWGLSVSSPALEQGLELTLFLRQEFSTVSPSTLPQPAARECTEAAAPLLSDLSLQVTTSTEKGRRGPKHTSALFCPFYPFVNKGWRLPGKTLRRICQISLFTPPPSALTAQGRVVGPAQYTCACLNTLLLH